MWSHLAIYIDEHVNKVLPSEQTLKLRPWTSGALAIVAGGWRRRTNNLQQCHKTLDRLEVARMGGVGTRAVVESKQALLLTQTL